MTRPARTLLLALLCATAAIAPLGAQAPLRDHVDASRLRTARDSLAVMLQGKEGGWQRLVSTRAGDGWEVRDAIAIGTMVQQESIILLSGDLAERSLRQSGQMQGAPMAISLDFDDGRVRGRAATPANPADAPVIIDMPVAAGTVDDNAVLPLLSAVAWHESFDATVPVLTSGKGTIVQYRLRVLGADTTTVPAGHFDTWRVEMSTESSTTGVHITRAAPYRVVRMQINPAFEMQLVKSTHQRVLTGVIRCVRRAARSTPPDRRRNEVGRQRDHHDAGDVQRKPGANHGPDLHSARTEHDRVRRRRDR